MATRRQCRNRIRSVGCLSAASSDASRFRCWRRVQSVRSADRHHRGRLLLPTLLGEARKVGRPPGRAPACPSGRAHSLASPASRAAQCGTCVSRSPIAGRRSQRQRRLRDGRLTGRTRRPRYRGESPGIRPGGRPAFLLRQKSGAKKATPMTAPRYAGFPRRWHRNREASELASLRQPTLLIRFRHQRRGAVYGELLQSQKQLQRQRQLQLQLQLSLRGQLQRQLSLRGDGQCR
jgi:hypothetical protein